MGCLFPYCKFGNLADETTVQCQKVGDDMYRTYE